MSFLLLYNLHRIDRLAVRRVHPDRVGRCQVRILDLPEQRKPEHRPHEQEPEDHEPGDGSAGEFHHTSA